MEILEGECIFKFWRQAAEREGNLGEEKRKPQNTLVKIIARNNNAWQCVFVCLGGWGGGGGGAARPKVMGALFYIK